MLLHLAKVLQISGFLLAAIFGGILLNREMFSRFTNKANSKLKDFTEAWTAKCLSIAKFGKFITSSESKRSILGSIIIRGISLTCIVIGWTMDITWLFWLGLIPASFYVLLSVIFILFKIKSRFGINKLWLYPLFLCWSLLLSFILAPAVVFIYLIVLYVSLLSLFSILIVAKEDALKKGLIIFGSILVVTGLIIETVITW